MKKIKYNLLHAFSITELIVTMLIVCLVVIASTPLFTMRKNSPLTNHGKYVCKAVYENNQWVLVEEKFDSKGNSVTLSGTGHGHGQCTFDMPTGVDNFNITAIGGGGGGAASRQGQIVRMWDEENHINESRFSLCGGNQFVVPVDLGFKVVGGGGGGGHTNGQSGGNGCCNSSTVSAVSSIDKCEAGMGGRAGQNGGQSVIRYSASSSGTLSANGGPGASDGESCGNCSAPTIDGNGKGGEQDLPGTQGVAEIYLGGIGGQKLDKTFISYEVQERLIGKSSESGKGRPLGGNSGQVGSFSINRADLLNCSGVGFILSGSTPGAGCVLQIGKGGEAGYSRTCNAGETPGPASNCGNAVGGLGGDTIFDTRTYSGGVGGQLEDYSDNSSSNSFQIPSINGYKASGEGYGNGGGSGSSRISYSSSLRTKRVMNFFSYGQPIVISNINETGITAPSAYTEENGQIGSGGAIIIEW